MNTAQRNEQTKRALGISTIYFRHYRAGKSHWLVTMTDGEKFRVVTPNLATESSVLRQMAEKLAELGRPVVWPKGA